MQVAKWGNSLAVRLPSSVVPTRAELIERLRTLRGTIPSDFKFDRVDANERQVFFRHQHTGLHPRG